MLLPLAVATFITTTMAAAANTEYLPPSNNGYHYNVPNKPFVSETVRPTLPPPVRQTTPPRDYLPPQTTRQPPQPQPQDHHHEEHDHHHHEPGMPFDFAYAVNEDGNDFSHNARSDGDVTKGEYRIALPDGRTQIVKYTADWKNGFNAEVTYEGEAKYPEETNTGYTSRPPANPGQSYLPPNQGGGYKY